MRVYSLTSKSLVSCPLICNNTLIDWRSIFLVAGSVEVKDESKIKLLSPCICNTTGKPCIPVINILYNSTDVIIECMPVSFSQNMVILVQAQLGH